MVKNSFDILTDLKAELHDLSSRYVDFTLKHQLLNRKTWQDFVELYRSDCDDKDTGWRCEFWGKMMRGAALTYELTKDEELYSVLEETVRDMLTAKRPDGRFSTYSKEAELNGWDMWGRKYILTGMMHFYRVCKNDTLKEEILDALKGHADRILDEVGIGKKNITSTSRWWGGVNSCSILEPMIDLYKLTGEDRYLKFGEYIISTGGCADGNLIELAKEGKLMPYQYPEVKAYETMSFFEGILAYYEVTGKKEYLDIVLKFAEAVYKTDITVIGCSGCTHELFDNSSLKQIEYSDNIMQETCVTVTWMRLSARLHLLTGDEKYYERIERSAYNALYGSVNSECLKQYSREMKSFMPPLPFDSYSPLFNQKRGIGIGGFKLFPFGGFYGCCACIASAGTAVFPLLALLKKDSGFIINAPLAGEWKTETVNNTEIIFNIESDYPKSLNSKISVNIEKNEEFPLSVRVPSFAENMKITVNGIPVDAKAQNGYLTLTRKWKTGDSITVESKMKFDSLKIGNKTAFLYGPTVLARDSAKENDVQDLAEPINLKTEKGKPVYHTENPVESFEETLRFRLARDDGKEDLLLTNYASCGKNWLGNKNRITVWMNVQ